MLDKKQIECACGGRAGEFFTDFHGFKVRGWKCRKCREEFLDPRGVAPILKLNKLIKENALKTKIGVVGNSMTLRIPKPLAEAYNLHKGEVVDYVLEKEGFMVKAEA
ncbi:MAG: AbrB/MazE/SpoVT family DNA-binding domain-containing protein [Nanoarchaeota archaeon]|nr:AbrB/MazE/SpoVT family DNA-binding domain-containing protein [Nanoarchaeota archaeon]